MAWRTCDGRWATLDRPFLSWPHPTQSAPLSDMCRTPLPMLSTTQAPVAIHPLLDQQWLPVTQ